MQEIIKVYGKNYKRAPEVKPSSCEGCSFLDGYCVGEGNHQEHCYDEQAIWVPAESSKASTEQKFTVDEFVDMAAFNGVYVSTTLVKQLKAMADPEYKQYLELKKKFG